MIRIVGALALALADPAAATQSLDRPITPGTPSAIPLGLKELGPDIFLITGRGANTVVRRTPDGLIVVDDKVMYPVVHRELVDLLRKRVSDLPIRYVFVTHHHADHSGNDQAMIDGGATLVGHRNIVDILRTYTSTIAPVNPAPPTVTFDRSYAVDLGGARALAYYWGPAHTGADIAVLFPQDRVVAVGDLLYGSGDLAVDALDGKGSLIGMRRRIDDLLRLDFDVAVPGHGDNVMTRGEIKLYAARLDRLIERGRAAVRRGVAPDGLVAAMRSDDLGFRLVGHFWRDPKYLRPIYEELRGVDRTRR